MEDEKSIRRKAIFFGTVLAILVAVGIAGYVFYISPPIREKYVGEWMEIEASRLPQYGSPELCSKCHFEQYSLWIESEHHSSIQCENCHGIGMKHIENPYDGNYMPRIDTSRDFCGICHESIPPRDESSAIKTVNLSTHNPEYSCILCHLPHRT